jgi:hypothetical protein
VRGGGLLRWWRSLWSSPPPSAPGPPPDPAPPRGGKDDDGDAGPARVPARRHYTAPPRDDDPQREARLGAVLEALGTSSLSRAELSRRVEGDAWGPGRFDAVVDHGVAAGVLRTDDSGVVRPRYAD